MRRLIGQVLFLLYLSGHASPLSSSPVNNDKNENNKNATPALMCGRDPLSPDFWRDLVMMPIQFTAKNKENTAFELN